MACGKCQKKNQSAQSNNVMSVIPSSSTCEYIVETTNSWLELLRCVNNQDLLTHFNIQKALYNSFLGILISINNNSETVCLFKTELDLIKGYILNIINENVQC